MTLDEKLKIIGIRWLPSADKSVLKLIKIAANRLAKLEAQLAFANATVSALRGQLESTTAERDAAQERERWVPVTERLPKKDGNYMTGASHWTEAHELMFSAKSNRWWNFSNSEYAEPTHWRELPQLPEADHAESV